MVFHCYQDLLLAVGMLETSTRYFQDEMLMAYASTSSTTRTVVYSSHSLTSSATNWFEPKTWQALEETQRIFSETLNFSLEVEQQDGWDTQEDLMVT